MGEGGEWRKEWRYVEVRLFAQVGEGVGDSTWKCLRFSVGHHPPLSPPVFTFTSLQMAFSFHFGCVEVRIFTQVGSRFSGSLSGIPVVCLPSHQWLSPSILDTASIKNWMWSGDEVKSLGYKSVSGKELIRLPLPVLVH